MLEIDEDLLRLYSEISVSDRLRLLDDMLTIRILGRFRGRHARKRSTATNREVNNIRSPSRDRRPIERPLDVIRELNNHGVKFVVIERIADTMYGSYLQTADLDIILQKSDENYSNLLRFVKVKGYKAKIDEREFKLKKPYELALTPFLRLVGRRKIPIDIFTDKDYSKKFDYDTLFSNAR
jgi:hypothetical protein